MGEWDPGANHTRLAENWAMQARQTAYMLALPTDSEDRVGLATQVLVKAQHARKWSRTHAALAEAEDADAISLIVGQLLEEGLDTEEAIQTARDLISRNE